MEIKSYILTVNFIFFKLVFLLCFRLSALTSLCVTSQGSDMSWRTIAKTLTVDTTRKCFKFSLFCFCSSQKVYFIFNLFFCFDGGCFRSNSCDLKGKPVKETNAFTLNRDFQRILFNLVSSHLVSVVSTYFYVRWSSFSWKKFFFSKNVLLQTTKPLGFPVVSSLCVHPSLLCSSLTFGAASFLCSHLVFSRSFLHADCVTFLFPLNSDAFLVSPGCCDEKRQQMFGAPGRQISDCYSTQWDDFMLNLP